MEAGEGTVLIVNVLSGRVLDADLSTIYDDGTKVQLWGTDAKERPNRRWKIEKDGKGTVRIVNFQSGRLLDADLATIHDDGTTVQLYGKDTKERSNRQWKIVEVKQ